MLRKILTLAVSICAATLFVSLPNALAWGCGSWNRSGSASYTGRCGNTYSRSWSSSGSGYHYGGWGGYHGGYHGGYYGGGAARCWIATCWCRRSGMTGWRTCCRTTSTTRIKVRTAARHSTGFRSGAGNIVSVVNRTA
jgi:hypothetical protein